ncbi:3'-5' exonuclease [Sphingobacteriales bacterium UPWRP_1]|nr:hypothetical protein B6N25_11280 [Sphingobacteriales bacterium TSM_CSS]PSJ72748.1 3'-5' exonuclease [Sphingobacteriales bacterium UPWRP_1]
MLSNIDMAAILFLDIETVPLAKDWTDLNPEMQLLWQYRTNRFKQSIDDDLTEEDYFFKKSGVYAEFGKVVCISAGIYRHPKTKEDAPSFRLKSFFGHDEKQLLTDFLQMLQTRFDPDRFYLCGHNIREFDVPYLCRRAIINGLPMPTILDVNALKPWELRFLDTMQLWKFGDYKNFTSLHLLTHLLNIPSPKEDMEGNQVAEVYWNEENGLQRIKTYCQQDVLAVAQVALRFKGLPLLTPEQVVEAE